MLQEAYKTLPERTIPKVLILTPAVVVVVVVVGFVIVAFVVVVIVVALALLFFVVVVPFAPRVQSTDRQLPITSALRKGGCFRMGRWGFAKREQLNFGTNAVSFETRRGGV